MAKPITNKVKTGEIPVIKKDLEDGVIAEANNDGTIYLDKNVKDGSPLAKEAIAHEMVHMDQMARGDLNYDDNNVYWKGKKYDRDDMNEGSKQLPWEAEAYQKTKNMKKSSPNKMNFGLSNRTLKQRAGILSDQLAAKADKHAAIGSAVGNVAGYLDNTAKFGKKADVGKNADVNNEEVVENTESNGVDMNYKNKNKSAMKMKATPITLKASFKKLKSSPLHVETTTTKEVRGNLEGQGAGTFIDTETKTETKKKKESVKNFANSCYNEDGSKKAEGTVVNGILCSWKSDEDFDPESEYDIEVKSDLKSEFKPDKVKTKEPGTPDKYNMGYYESMDAKWAQGVRRREGKQTLRQNTRDQKKYDRLAKRGKLPLNAEGEPMSKMEYLKARSGGEANFNQKIGTLKRGKPEGPEVESNAGADENLETFKIVDGKRVPVNMNTKNKSKAPFKMKGFSGFNK